MKFSKIECVSKDGTRNALSNIYDSYKMDNFTIMDTVEDSNSVEEIVANINRLPVHYHFEADRTTDSYIRLKGKDVLGNIKYLIISL